MEYFGNCINYPYHPNLLFIVKSSKNIEDNETINPNIIIGFDLELTWFLVLWMDEDEFLSLSLSLLRRFEKSLLTLKNRFN